jgi:hypothetical protein
MTKKIPMTVLGLRISGERVAMRYPRSHDLFLAFQIGSLTRDVRT